MCWMLLDECHRSSSTAYYPEQITAVSEVLILKL